MKLPTKEELHHAEHALMQAEVRPCETCAPVKAMIRAIADGRLVVCEKNGGGNVSLNYFPATTIPEET